mgnify:FL=1
MDNKDIPWEMVVGLEIHVQINSKSKAFCSDQNLFIDEPNRFISPITLAHPGTLPRYNEYHIESAVKLGSAFGSKINEINYFDRKNYFYPDLPKGYQITQDEKPICTGGKFSFPTGDGSIKTLRIHHIHMEEDAGKSIHDQHPEKTFLDFNRAGVPLLEIVTEPELYHPDEVYYCIHHMQMLVRYLGISDGNMEEGSFRCDCNVSVKRKNESELGVRCEIKNLNSKKFARNAVEFEKDRQIKLIEDGGSVKKTTLLFDSATGKTFPMRDKEEVNDYRYFNDPDLPPVMLTKEYIERIKAQMLVTPFEWYTKLTTDYGLTVKEAEILIENKACILLLEKMINSGAGIRESVLLIINKVVPSLQITDERLFDQDKVVNRLCEFISIIEDGTVSKSVAYQFLFDELVRKHFDIDLTDLAHNLGLIQTSDMHRINEWVKEVLDKNPDKVEEYRKGKKNLMGFFMGQIMRISGGKANPNQVQSTVIEFLKHPH